MGKKLIVLALCLLLLAGIGTVAVSAAAGGPDDPLLSLSYLYNTFLPKLQSLFTKETEEGLGALSQEYNDRLDALHFPEEDEWDRVSVLTALDLSDGGSVRLAPFGKFLLTEGEALLQVIAGEVIDLSEGRVCADGEWLKANHRYFAAEDSEARIRMYGAGQGYVDGRYLAEIAGTFAPEERFLDLSGHWGRSSILALAEKGLVNGMDEHHFEPDRKVTRAMFVTILGRMNGGVETLSAPSSFRDVLPEDWFAPYVDWAASCGVVTGYDDGTFAPNREITREQMALILVRYCDAFGRRLPEGEAGAPFTDEGSISPWAFEAVLAARAAGLINGRDDGSFDPQGTATRAEMCAVIARLMDKLASLPPAEETPAPSETAEPETTPAPSETADPTAPELPEETEAPEEPGENDDLSETGSEKDDDAGEDQPLG